MDARSAYKLASERAKHKGQWRYVIVDCGEYEVASEYDLETFFQGCNQILAAFGPDGQQETN